jgi:uncharacterized OsmC-like protein
MSSVLSVRAVHQGEMRIIATAGIHSVAMDYPLGPEEPAAMRPLEMLLASLAGCSGNTLALLLRRAGQPMRGLEVNAQGVRRDEHPTVFSEISWSSLCGGPAWTPRRWSAPSWSLRSSSAPSGSC